MSQDFSVNAGEAARLCSLNAYQVLGETLSSIADADDDLTVVVSDYGRRLSLDTLRAHHPASYVQVGIAEQDQVSVSAALALEGFRVFAPCYASFVTGRAFDQVRVNLGIMAAPVVLVGIAAGYDSGDLGASHMSTEDVALMRSVPGLTVVSPADNAELACVLRQLAADPVPAYVRVTGAGTHTLVHDDGCSWEPGRMESLRAGGDVAILATGQLVTEALAAAEALSRQGIEASVTAVPTLSPLDETALAASLGTSRLAVTVEEHSPRGGLGSAVAESLSQHPGSPALLRLGTPERYVDGDVRENLIARAGLDATGIARGVAERLAALS